MNLRRTHVYMCYILEYVSWNMYLLGGQSVPEGSRNPVVCV